jgi:hypothetical protein
MIEGFGRTLEIKGHDDHPEEGCTEPDPVVDQTIPGERTGSEEGQENLEEIR